MTDEDTTGRDLFIASLVLRCQSLVLALVRARLPASAQLLCDVSDRHAGMCSLHLRTLIVTEAEESRSTQASSSTQRLEFPAILSHGITAVHSSNMPDDSVKDPMIKSHGEGRGGVYHNDHCNMQPCAHAGHPYHCSAQVDSAFYPPGMVK